MAYKESVDIRKKSCEVKKKTFLIEKYHFFKSIPKCTRFFTKNDEKRKFGRRIKNDYRILKIGL